MVGDVGRGTTSLVRDADNGEGSACVEQRYLRYLCTFNLAMDLSLL